jgi:hypothetical protein
VLFTTRVGWKTKIDDMDEESKRKASKLAKKAEEEQLQRLLVRNIVDSQEWMDRPFVP